MAFRPQVSGLGRVLRALGALGVGLSALAGCHSDQCFKSAGEVTTERRALPPFEKLSVADNVRVTLVQDAETYAEVTTGSHLQADLKLEVRGPRLYISNESRCNWARSYDVPHAVTLHLPTLREVDHIGQATVSTQGEFRADTLFLHMSGTGDYDLSLRSNYLWVDQYELGDYRLRGSTDELHLTGGSLGRFFAADLRARACYVNLTTFADNEIRIYGSDVVAGTHAGSGTVYYAGRPPFTDLRLTGRGRIVRVE